MPITQRFAIASTGTGEFYMRGQVTYDVVARLRYTSASLGALWSKRWPRQCRAKKGDGGLIALNARGEMKLAFNTDGMFRGYVRADGKPVVLMFGD
jgi:beta-aspartyl-peptidase (threonine type)